MARKSAAQIEEDEQKIINELKINARGSIEHIANKYHFSRQKVWRIIKRLELNKSIWGYHTITDDESFNQQRFVVLIKRSTEPIDEAIENITNLSTNKNKDELGVSIECSSFLHGQYDWMFIVTTEDLKSLKKFTHFIAKEYEKWISEICILEYIFPVVKCGILNPNKDHIKELF